MFRYLLAIARVKGYRNLFIGTEIVAKEIKNYEEFIVKNGIAFAELLISCELEAAFEIVHTSCSEEHPEGDVNLAWKREVKRTKLYQL